MCWLPRKQLQAGSQTGALLLGDALRMGFTPSLSLGGRWGQSGCVSVSPALNRVSCCFCGSAPKSSKEGKRRGVEIMWQTEQGWAESRAGRRAARHTDRLARCPPLHWLAPHFPWLPPTFLQGNSWPGLETTGGGCQGRQQPLGTRARAGSSQMVPWGKGTTWDVFTSWFLKAGQPLHLTLGLLPSICLHSRISAFLFSSPPLQKCWILGRKKGKKPNQIQPNEQSYSPWLG